MSVVLLNDLKGNNFEEKVLKVVEMFVEMTDGDRDEALYALATNLIIRDLIIDIDFGTTKKQKEKMFKDTIKIINKFEKKGE